MLNLILAESALELVPKEIRKRPAIVNDSKRRGIDANGILLDRSFHHSAMTGLKDSEKRGRPDLVHATLLSATGTPIYLRGLVKVYVHTYDDWVLEIEPKTRIPKNYLRFRGLMEEVLVEKPLEGLVTAYPMQISELARKLSADLAVGLSVQGKMTPLGDLARTVVEARAPVVVVGGFPRGHFTERTLSVLDQLVRIHADPLEAHVVVSRILYEVERRSEGFND